MGAGHIPEHGRAVMDTTSGSGPSMLTQREEDGPGLLAAQPLLPAVTHRSQHSVPAVTRLCQHRGHRRPP